MSLALDGRGMVYALLQPLFMYLPFAFCILHFAFAPLQKNPSCDGAKHKEGDGEDIGPGNVCRRIEGEENLACGQIPSNHSPH